MAAQISRILDRPISGGVNIVGTSDSKEVQIYGWQSPVATHTDNTGYMFFMPIVIPSGTDQLIYEDQTLDLEVGHLYLMDDSKPHSTIGLGNVISLFVGSFKEEEISDELIAEVYQKCLDYLAVPD